MQNWIEKIQLKLARLAHWLRGLLPGQEGDWLKLFYKKNSLPYPLTAFIISWCCHPALPLVGCLTCSRANHQRQCHLYPQWTSTWEIFKGTKYLWKEGIIQAAAAESERIKVTGRFITFRAIQLDDPIRWHKYLNPLEDEPENFKLL